MADSRKTCDQKKCRASMSLKMQDFENNKLNQIGLLYVQSFLFDPNFQVGFQKHRTPPRNLSTGQSTPCGVERSVRSLLAVRGAPKASVRAVLNLPGNDLEASGTRPVYPLDMYGRVPVFGQKSSPVDLTPHNATDRPGLSQTADGFPTKSG